LDSSSSIITKSRRKRQLDNWRNLTRRVSETYLDLVGHSFSHLLNRKRLSCCLSFVRNLSLQWIQACIIRVINHHLCHRLNHRISGSISKVFSVPSNLWITTSQIYQLNPSSIFSLINKSSPSLSSKGQTPSCRWIAINNCRPWTLFASTIISIFNQVIYAEPLFVINN
jgi:hypothetical protein